MLYIREIAKKNNIPLYQLAQKINITSGSLSTLLNKGNMTLATLEKIANGLGVPIEQLFINPDKETNPTNICPYCGKPITICIKKAQIKSSN